MVRRTSAVRATAGGAHSPTFATVHAACSSIPPSGGLTPAAVGSWEARMSRVAAGTKPMSMGRDMR